MRLLKKVILTIFGISVLIHFQSCTDNFEHLNTDPSLVNMDVVDFGMQLTQSQKNAVFNIPQGGVIKEYAYYYANPASGNIFLDTDRSGFFNSWYRDHLINMAVVVQLTEDDPFLSNLNAIARIWRVWLAHHVTDIFGDVPYSEAATDFENPNTQPVYDTQESIYRSMLNELREAASDLNHTDDLASFDGADLLFNGDVGSWERFANSLRLRLAIRVRYADENLANEHISEVINAPLISNNSQNPSITTDGIDADDRDNRNPLYNAMETGLNPLNCTFIVTEALQDRNDPRLPVYCQEAEDGESGYRGRPLQFAGQDVVNYYTNQTTALLGEFFIQPEYTINVMTHAEVEFLIAEAFLAGLANGDAEAAYRTGIRASMEQYSVDESDILDYLDGPEGRLDGSQEEQLEQIAYQKYLALYQQPHEAWTEYRRTGYPRMWTGEEVGDTGGNIPRRLTYPLAEYDVNSSNIQDAVNRLDGGDDLMSRVWWDAKPGLPFEHPKQGQFPPN